MLKIAYHVNNLSDARNFAANLFDWIFFKVDQQGNYDLALYNSLADWVTGAQRGIHLSADSSMAELFVHKNVAEGIWIEEFQDKFSLPGVSIFSPIEENRPDYMIHKELMPVGNFGNQIIDLSSIPFANRNQIHLNNYAGIALRGGDEIKPGLRDFDAINDWIDWLSEQEDQMK